MIEAEGIVGRCFPLIWNGDGENNRDFLNLSTIGYLSDDNGLMDI